MLLDEVAQQPGPWLVGVQLPRAAPACTPPTSQKHTYCSVKDMPAKRTSQRTLNVVTMSCKLCMKQVGEGGSCTPTSAQNRLHGDAVRLHHCKLYLMPWKTRSTEWQRHTGILVQAAPMLRHGHVGALLRIPSSHLVLYSPQPHANHSSKLA